MTMPNEALETTNQQREKRDHEAVAFIRSAVPEEGLFADKEWLISPTPFFVGDRCAEELEKLGYRLNLFVRACNRLYQLSIQGKQPAWVANYLDLGKPPELVEYARQKLFRDEIPLVIRPDVILTEHGFTIAELDSVPGGIGLTGWLNQTYSQLGFDVLGGAQGMQEGFHSLMPRGGEILISEEAATYRPEMQWLSKQINQAHPEAPLVVKAVEAFSPEAVGTSREVYRFFELFDLPNLPTVPALMEAAQDGKVRITPPIKPYMEEKMWFALFWMRPLREFWRRELSDRHFQKLQQVIPYTWIVDPAPLPHNAAIPRLDIHDWAELGSFSQKQRELILKISGYSELAWGSRGVVFGQDMPQHEWKAAVGRAIDLFEKSPRILQQFHKARVIEQPYHDLASNTIRVMQARVRLCPYYFITDSKTTLSGALATICPADKKLLHGMKDAILAPAAVKMV